MTIIYILRDKQVIPLQVDDITEYSKELEVLKETDKRVQAYLKSKEAADIARSIKKADIQTLDALLEKRGTTLEGMLIKLISAGTPVVKKQVEYGEITDNGANYQTYKITFVTPFTTAPFVVPSSHIQEDLLSWKVLNPTTTGFTLEGYGNAPGNYSGKVSWKAEEK